MYIFRYIGRKLAHFLAKPRPDEEHFSTSNPQLLQRTLRKGDILLIEGTSRFSTSVKFFTQSTWSHALLYIGDHLHDSSATPEDEILSLLEVDVEEGVRVVPLSMYHEQHSRICRPIGLSENEINQVLQFAVDKMGNRYDLKNIFDLARFLIPTPPIPAKWRRRVFSLGSGDPTRAICSSLIAQAFQSINYPILPDTIYVDPNESQRISNYQKLHRHRDPSFFAPRDFDVSPYFEVIKPIVQNGFNHHKLQWQQGVKEQPNDIENQQTTATRSTQDSTNAVVKEERVGPVEQANESTTSQSIIDKTAAQPQPEHVFDDIGNTISFDEQINIEHDHKAS
jgi:hypothetical protein